MAKRKQQVARGAKVAKRGFNRTLLAIPLIALIFKMFIILRIPAIAWPSVDPNLYRLDKFWMGADGENYVTGLTGLFADGIFSDVQRLTYFPAGYPILIYFVAFFSQSWSLPIIAFLQTLLYAGASIYFVHQLTRTRLAKFAWFVALILAFNPTLSFNSYAIGYESLVASLLLISFGLLIQDYQKSNSKFISREIILVALLLGLTSFVQPRMVATAFLIFILWALATRAKVAALGLVVISMVITLFFPASLYIRNVVARDVPAVSTNLGTTIFIGIGPDATGGYNGSYNGVPCPEAVGTEAEVDNAKVRCAIKWYLANPGRSLELAAKKAVFYWSPWFGPVANGTMARNPWNQNHPLKSTAQNQQGYDLIFGTTGKVISWLWLLSTIGFMFFGFWILWRANGLERLLGVTSLAVIIVNMLVSMVTIGDHRFRLPVAGLSLFLQGIGLTWAFSKRVRRSITGEEKLLWKSLTRTTNL